MAKKEKKERGRTSGDGLAVPLVLDISRGEHSLDVGVGGAGLNLHISFSVQRQLAGEGAGVGNVTDGIEKPVDIEDGLLLGDAVDHLEPTMSGGDRRGAQAKETRNATYPVRSFPLPVASRGLVFQTSSILGFLRSLACMTAEALSLSLLTITYTLEAYLVRKVASSAAESPPPITARGLFLKRGRAPVVTKKIRGGQGEKKCNKGFNTIAYGAGGDSVLPVLVLSRKGEPLGGGAGRHDHGFGEVRLLALIALSPQLEGPLREINLANGLPMVQTNTHTQEKTRGRQVSQSNQREEKQHGGYEMTVVPNFSDCFFMFSMISGPMMPSGNPGKFSRSVVVVSWPPAQEKTQNGIHIVGNSVGLGQQTGDSPAATPPARNPSKRIG